MEKTIKICKVKFDKDYYQQNKDTTSPVADIVCDYKTIGTIELGYYGFNLFNKVKTVPVNASYIGTLIDLHEDLDKYTLKQIMYNSVLAAIHQFEIEINDGDECVYIINTVEDIDSQRMYKEFGIGTFIDACYAYIPNIKSMGKEFHNREISSFNKKTKKKQLNGQIGFDEDRYTEYKEADNPAYSQPDDPDKELNARYE